MKNDLLPKKYRKLILVAFFGTFICFFNQTTINPALPTIMRDFNITASTAQWLLSGYLMVMAIVVPLNAYLIERFDVKKIYTAALSIYLLGCIITGLGINYYLTLAGRVMQGMGHGIIMPTSMATMLYIFPKEKRGIVLGVYGLLIGFAPILGPSYSGIVVDNLSWHFVYFGVAILALLGLLGSIILVPKLRVADTNNSKLDALSIITSTLGLGLVLFSCSEVGSLGFTPLAFTAFFIGLAIIVYFIWRQLHIPNPMLEVRVFKYKNFTVGMILLSFVQLAFMGAVVLFPFLIQNVLGESPTVAGLVMVPSAIVTGLMSPITGRLFDNHGLRYLGIIGLSVLTIAGLCLSILTETSPIWLLIIFLCVRNFGASFVLMNANTWALNTLPVKLLPHGNATASTIRLTAMAFASAISTTIYTYVANGLPGGVSDPSAGIIGINASFFYQAVLTFIGVFVCIFFVWDKNDKESDSLSHFQKK